MMSESINTGQEEKEGYVLNDSRIMYLNNLITSIDKFLVWKECAQERELQIKPEEEIDIEKFIDYVEYSFQLIPSDEQKWVRELHEYFNKKTYNR